MKIVKQPPTWLEKIIALAIIVIAIVGAAIAIHAWAQARAERNAEQLEKKGIVADSKFAAVSIGDSMWDVADKIGKSNESGEITNQTTVPMPSLNGGTTTEQYTTVRYRLDDGSWMYVTYNGTTAMSKVRGF
jgi:hypothetical protein